MPINHSITNFGPLYTTGDTTKMTANNLRLANQAEVNGRAGALGGNDYKVTAGAGLTLNIAPGVAYVRGTSSLQGFYKQVMSSAGTVTLDTNSGFGGARVDRIFLAIRDQEYSGDGDSAVIYVIPGGRGGGLPLSLTSMTANYKAYFELAQVTMADGATTTASATIVDVRTFTSQGLMAATSVTLPSTGSVYPTPAPFSGQGVYETNTNDLKFWSGANWKVANQGRLRVATAQGATGASAPSATSTDTSYYTQAGSLTTGLDGSKQATISFPIAFTGGILTVVANIASQGTGLNNSPILIDAFSGSSFRVTLPLATTTGPWRINYVAVGW